MAEVTSDPNALRLMGESAMRAHHASLERYAKVLSQARRRIVIGVVVGVATIVSMMVAWIHPDAATLVVASVPATTWMLAHAPLVEAARFAYDETKAREEVALAQAAAVGVHLSPYS